MNATAAPFFLPPLLPVLRAVEPATHIVSPRLLRRVIRRDCGLSGAGLVVPHSEIYWIAREPLVQIIRAGELGVDPLPEKILLFARIRDDGRPAPLQLRDCWRHLYHAGIDRAIDRRLACGALSTAAIRDRLDTLGPGAWHEIKAVLRSERRWLPPGDPGTLWREFVALYLELKAFTPHLLPVYFPSLTHTDALEAIIAKDVTFDKLLEECRPAGAAALWEPSVCSLPTQTLSEAAPEAGPGSISRFVEAAAHRGNDVRAAILAARTAPDSPPERSPALPYLSRLADRLQTALPGDEHHQSHWREVLLPLLGPASRGLWPPAARFLYDLQKVCVDYERPLFTIDLVEWIGSLGKRPLIRRLTAPRDVRALRYLRSAERRLAMLPITDGQRFHLGQVLHHEIERASQRLRQRLGPDLLRVLDDVGLTPANLPEDVSQAKLVDELLDQVVEKGFLSLGDLRDAVARNQVKLPDLGSAGWDKDLHRRDSLFFRFALGPLTAAVLALGITWLLHGDAGDLLREAIFWPVMMLMLSTVRGGAMLGEFLLGDPLLRAHRKLKVTLDGVYQRAEFYLRWLQSGSSLFFGTHFGRVLTLWGILPFGGAWLFMVFLYLVPEEAVKYARLLRILPKPEHEEHHVVATTTPGVLIPALLLGIFLLGVMHSATFRQRVGVALRHLGHWVWVILVDLPVWLAHSPLLWPLFTGPLARFIGRYLLVPAGTAGILAVSLAWADVHPTTNVRASLFCFGAVLMLLATRVGQDILEMLADGLAHAWRLLTFDLWQQLFRLFLDVFGYLVERIERGLYTVDEWLRFRQGESVLMIPIKAGLGVVWFGVTWLIRLYINLLIEPQLNPIKHFPTVTVAAKLMLPILPAIYLILYGVLKPFLGTLLAGAFAGLTVFFLPGVFGFLIWELTGNWGLYRANRPATLRAATIGHHGETMRGLLAPGFHSGTIPKLYTRWRRLERKAARTGSAVTNPRGRLPIEHTAEFVAAFVEREMIALLRRSPRWGGLPLRITDVSLTTNRVLVMFEAGPGTVEVRFEYQSGWLLGQATLTGLDGLSAEARSALDDALTGLYHLAGVNVSRERLTALLGPFAGPTEWSVEALHVWSGRTKQSERVYAITAEAVLTARTPDGEPDADWPALAAEEVFWDRRPMAWGRWVTMWAGRG